MRSVTINCYTFSGLCCILPYNPNNQLYSPNFHQNSCKISSTSVSNVPLDNIDLFLNLKKTGSLTLANFWSCIDWLVYFFSVHNINAKYNWRYQVRYVFVCDAFICFILIINWYHEIVTEILFVWIIFKRGGIIIITKDMVKFYQAHSNRIQLLKL